MARLLTVVNERKKLRSEYRYHLEKEFIAECKAKEAEELMERNELAKERGEKVIMTAEQSRQYIVARQEKQKEKINFIRDELIEKFEDSKSENSASVVAPLLDETDITFVAQSQVKLS